MESSSFGDTPQFGTTHSKFPAIGFGGESTANQPFLVFAVDVGEVDLWRRFVGISDSDDSV
jgi:hypothetical protein